MLTRRWPRSASTLPGAKQVFYGICLLLVVMVAAGRRVAMAGSARMRLDGERAMTALLAVEGVSKRFRGLIAVDGVSFDSAGRRHLRA